MAAAMVICVACGQIYRPVVIPCTGNSGLPNCPVEPLPSPANFHAVFGLYTNAPNGISPNTPNYYGGLMQIDVSGDTIVAETPSSSAFGNNPTYAALLPGSSKMYVSSAGSVSGGVDLISEFTTETQTLISSGFGNLTSIALPAASVNITGISEAGNVVTATLSAPLTTAPVGYTVVIAGTVIECTQPCNQNAYNGAFTLTSNSGTTITLNNPLTGLPALTGAQIPAATAVFPPQPVALTSAQASAMFVANYNANSVAEINTTSNFVSNSAAVGEHPVSLAELPNGLKLYVANQGDNTVSSLNTANLSSNTLTGFAGTTPVWIVARNDSQKVYVLSQGDGQLWTINATTDSVACPSTTACSLPVGAGADFIFYDVYLGRLYVTNPVTQTVYVFSDTGGAGDTPMLMTSISFAAGSAMCPTGCVPDSVTSLPDGSGFYVASYELYAAGTCPDPVIGAANPCVVPTLSVFDANSLAPQVTPALTLLAWSPPCTPPSCTTPPPQGPFATNQFAVAPAVSCVVTTPYTPSTPRFRVFTVSSADSSRVYVSMCDAGAIADINTTDNNPNNTESGLPPNTLVTDLPAAFSSAPAGASGQPPSQNPIFMLRGQ